LSRKSFALKRTLAVLLSAAMVFGPAGTPAYAETAAQTEELQASGEPQKSTELPAENNTGSGTGSVGSGTDIATGSNAETATGSNAETATGSDAISEDNPDGTI